MEVHPANEFYLQTREIATGNVVGCAGALEVVPVSQVRLPPAPVLDVHAYLADVPYTTSKEARRAVTSSQNGIRGDAGVDISDHGLTLDDEFPDEFEEGLVQEIYRRLTRTSVSDIPGPEPESLVLGNLRQFFQCQAGEIDFKWQELYGDVVRFKGPFGEDRLLVSDPKALQHIYQTSRYDFAKQAERREVSRLISGRGVLWAHGHDHQRQRKIMNPAFGPRETKAFAPLFSDVASKLGGKWKDFISQSPNQESVIDMTKWIGPATLDAMGIAAFDYEFGTLDNSDNELGNVFANMCVEVFGSLSAKDILRQALAGYLPKAIFRYIGDNAPNHRLEQLRKASAVATKVAKELIDGKVEALEVGKGKSDVMSLLVQANVSEDESTRMSEEEMIAQMRTFLLAGYETTATSLCWALLEIARHQDVQTKLRHEIHRKEREIRERGDRGLSASDFDTMPYLTAVIKESLRFHPASPSTYRETMKEDVLPLLKPITTLSGKVITELPVPKGLKVVTSINGYNRHKDVFGSDSHVYDPERWLVPGRIEKTAYVGVYGNLLSFAGGVR
ncbi:unnamed protein product [Cyclocybe aegerita]|uniref:Cytochrome P450 n=1 Tax=Cyclocybe aegerita TaxID=1973307 RepID=A0A8S0W7S7_CYCAE|nr:unnamed protein product [Cyclocybe aegerita]